jgi:UDP-N-acetylmuramyl pentapeptide phosphotransferase/UDP-N-acetylglucosamine-1-phosphate transferase
VVGSDLDGLDGLEVVPCLRMGAACGQIDFESLEDDGDAGSGSQTFSWK